MTNNQYPEYFSVHKIDAPGRLQWDLSDPTSFNGGAFEEILDTFGTRGTEKRRLAVAYSFSYARFPIGNVAAGIKNMLKLSAEYDVPVILHLDGVNYTDAHPELWNWWDSTLDGYAPANITNVERYGWDEETAVKIGWRNWGSQIRVKPAPNLASPAFLALQERCLREFLPIIAGWYNALSPDKKYLLGGVVFGWELSPYVQSYYYGGGNDMLLKPSALDPTGGVTESMPLGYAAAATLGIQSQGVITAETEDKICSFYLRRLIGIALEHGVDPSRIITHTYYGGETKHGGGHSGIASVSEYGGVVPGWSFYGGDISEMDAVTSLADGKPWAAIEYKPWDLSAQLLERTFAYKGCRYVNIYNWESIRDDEKTLAEIRKIL